MKCAMLQNDTYFILNGVRYISIYHIRLSKHILGAHDQLLIKSFQKHLPVLLHLHSIEHIFCVATN